MTLIKLTDIANKNYSQLGCLKNSFFIIIELC